MFMVVCFGFVIRVVLVFVFLALCVSSSLAEKYTKKLAGYRSELDSYYGDFPKAVLAAKFAKFFNDFLFTVPARV